MRLVGGQGQAGCGTHCVAHSHIQTLSQRGYYHHHFHHNRKIYHHHHLYDHHHHHQGQVSEGLISLVASSILIPSGWECHYPFLTITSWYYLRNSHNHHHLHDHSATKAKSKPSKVHSTTENPSKPTPRPSPPLVLVD